MVAFFKGIIWEPTGPATTDIANLVDQKTLDFGAIPFASGYYVFKLRLQIGWNAGASGANNLNGVFTFYDGVDSRQSINWGRLKTGSAGFGYGTAEEFGLDFVTIVTQGNHLSVVASQQAYILGGQLTVYELPPYQIDGATLT